MTEDSGNATPATFALSMHGMNTLAPGSLVSDNSVAGKPDLLGLILAFLPGCIIVATLLYDLFWSQVVQKHYPSVVLRLFRAIRRPFRDFLQPEDLEGKPGPALVPSAWKSRTLVALSTVQAIWWAALLAFILIAGHEQDVLSVANVLVGLIAWVSKGTETVLKTTEKVSDPSHTPL